MPRTNWHLDVGPIDDSDPFATPPPEVERVDLSDAEQLHVQLLGLMRREGQLQDAGVRCAIKDRPDSCCSACPLYDRVQHIRELCHVGRDQERTTMAMIAHE